MLKLFGKKVKSIGSSNNKKPAIKQKEMWRNTKSPIGKIRKVICRILLITLLCTYELRNLCTKPSWIISPWTCTSYEICKPAKFGFRNIFQPYLNLVQSLNSKQQPLPKSFFTCKQITTFGPNKNTARLPIHNYDYPNSKFSKTKLYFSCGHSVEHLAGTNQACKWTTCPASPGAGHLLYKHCTAPTCSHLSSLTCPRPNLAGEPRKSSRSSPLGSPLKPCTIPYPDAPACLMGSPQLETTALYLPLHFSVPETTVLRRTRPLSVPTATAYKRPPLLAEKTHTITRNLPDILSISPSP
jgi:hypothetical protein